MLHKLERTEAVRLEVSPRLDQARKAEFGQFMTPSRIARFMASLFPPSTEKTCRLLDAGAGLGALTCAFLDRWQNGGFGFQSVKAFAYEIDDDLRDHLLRHLGSYTGVEPHIFAGDFIEHATRGGLLAHPAAPIAGGYSHAILNPPYKKIGNASPHRHALRTLGIETVNLYSAFIALAVALATPGGQIVAIIPRSFCNGPYYRPFREFILARTALRRMHLFESRSSAFKDDRVLQENMILHLERDGQQGRVVVSTSADDSFEDLATHEYPFNQIVLPGDSERFIHVPTSPARGFLEGSTTIRFGIAEIGAKISTGPVVDFRLKDHLRAMPEQGTVPLLYPGHFNKAGILWPQPESKKPNAILRNATTEQWLYPAGFYCVVRRFSAKEERRRIVASVVDPSNFPGASMLGFENHLNVFHENRRGLPKSLAHGLAAFLNTTAVDTAFRRFNGHTQVNATDLKLIQYPSREALMALGAWAEQQNELTQEMLDDRLRVMA